MSALKLIVVFSDVSLFTFHVSHFATDHSPLTTTMLQPNFKPFPILTTERLVLRKLMLADAPAIFELRSKEEVMKYIDRPVAKSIADAETFINVISQSLDQNNGITWAMALKDEPGSLIGTIGFWRLIKEHYRAEIGYMLHPSLWKKGITKEAIIRLLDYAFDDMNLHSIEAHISPENIASASILTSTGFVQEAYFKEDYFWQGKFTDTAIFSRLKPA